MDLKQELVRLRACSEAVEWVGKRTLEQAWAECERADWMMWLARKRGWLTYRQSVLLAVGFAELARKRIPVTEIRTLGVIDTALDAARLCADDPTPKNKKAAVTAAGEAAVTAAWAARAAAVAAAVAAAWAARAAAWAARAAAWAAAVAAAWAARAAAWAAWAAGEAAVTAAWAARAAAWAAEHRAMCQMIREVLPRPTWRKGVK